MASNIYHYGIKMFQERVTGLESYAACPYKYDKVPFDGSNIDTLVAVTIGDIVHIAHQYPQVATVLCDIFFDQTLVELTGKRDNMKKEQTMKMIDLACNWIDEFKDYEKYFEVKNSKFISGILVTGSYDCLMIDKDGVYHLWDYKTTNNISYYNNWVEKIQALVYSYFIMKQFGVDKIRFTYQIYIKGKNNTKVESARKEKTMYLNKVNLLNQKDYIDGVGEMVERLCANYKESKEGGWFLPKETNIDGTENSSCWYCPMRNQQKAEEAGLQVCPLKTDQSVLDNGEISF